MVGATHKIFFTVCQFKSVCLVPRFTDRKRTLKSGLTCQEGMEDDTVERACCIRSYHVYKEIWEAAVSEILMCERESRNAADKYAVAVKKDRTIIGHLPRKVSRVCSLFLWRGRIIHCTVTGRRRYSGDLPLGGLEVPCILAFQSRAKIKELAKLKHLLKAAKYKSFIVK